MKRVLLLAMCGLPLWAQGSFDFSLLDKVGANAQNKTSITLDRNMLKLASGFLGNDDQNQSVKGLVKDLKGIYIRTFEFDKPGQYNDADLEPFRAFLRQGKWNRIVESREKGESSEIFVQAAAGEQVNGIAVVAAAAKEVTVVYIDGPMNMSDLGSLSGNMGIPKIKLDHSEPNSGKKPAPAKKED